MSIRIHALAKELNIPSKELIDFINQRKDKYGLEIKTSSNAIAPLYAEEIANDYKATATAANAKPEAAADAAPAPEKAEEPKKVVKTAAEVEAEKKAEEAAKKEEANPAPKAEEQKAATPPPPPPAPAVKTPPTVSKPPVMTPPPAPVRKPAPVVPPVAGKPAPGSSAALCVAPENFNALRTAEHSEAGAEQAARSGHQERTETAAARANALAPRVFRSRCAAD